VRSPVAVLALAVTLVAGCASDDKTAFEPVSDATHVTGTLKAIDDQRPVDGGVILTIRTGEGKDEPVTVPSMFTGEPPTTIVLALQAKVNELRVGARITAIGVRDQSGTFIVERIETP
jgi:hypothetical protein